MKPLSARCTRNVFLPIASPTIALTVPVTLCKSSPAFSASTFSRLARKPFSCRETSHLFFVFVLTFRVILKSENKFRFGGIHATPHRIRRVRHGINFGYLVMRTRVFRAEVRAELHPSA